MKRASERAPEGTAKRTRLLSYDELDDNMTLLELKQIPFEQLKPRTPTPSKISKLIMTVVWLQYVMQCKHAHASIYQENFTPMPTKEEPSPGNPNPRPKLCLPAWVDRPSSVACSASVKMASEKPVVAEKAEASKLGAEGVVAAPKTPLAWRMARRVCQLRWYGYSFDRGQRLRMPPRKWTEDFLSGEGRGLLGLINDPDFNLTDVLPGWVDDGWFWWAVDYPKELSKRDLSQA